LNTFRSDRIKENLFNASNVVVTCSASGKLTTSLVSYWVDKVLRPSLSGKTLLISDCWNGQGDNKGLYDGIKGLFRVEIPAKTTSYRQPLDIYFNRQLKVLARRIYDRVTLDEINIHMGERNNLIKLQSLIHNQLSSDVFSPMIKYAWFKAGYTDTDPSPFKSVSDVCFNFKDIYCDVTLCDGFAFIQFSHCGVILCFHHFFVLYHFH